MTNILIFYLNNFRSIHYEEKQKLLDEIIILKQKLTHAHSYTTELESKNSEINVKMVQQCEDLEVIFYLLNNKNNE